MHKSLLNLMLLVLLCVPMTSWEAEGRTKREYLPIRGGLDYRGLPKRLSPTGVKSLCKKRCATGSKRCLNGCLHARKTEQSCTRKAIRGCASSKKRSCPFSRYRRCMCRVFSKDLPVRNKSLFTEKCLVRVSRLKKRSELRYSYKMYRLLKPLYASRRFPTPTGPRYMKLAGRLPKRLGLGVQAAMNYCSKDGCKDSMRKLKMSRSRCMNLCVYATYREQRCLYSSRMHCERKFARGRCTKHFYKICLTRSACRKKRGGALRRCLKRLVKTKVPGVLTTFGLVASTCQVSCRTKRGQKKTRCLDRCRKSYY